MGPVGSRKRAARLGCAAGTAASKVLISLPVLRLPKARPAAYPTKLWRCEGGEHHPPSFCARRPDSTLSGCWQDEIAVLLPQRGLEDLSRGCVRNFGDEDHVVGKPPACDLALHKGQDFFLRGRVAFFRHDNQKRALIPFRMLDADHGGLADFGVTSGEVLQLD